MPFLWHFEIFVLKTFFFLKDHQQTSQMHYKTHRNKMTGFFLNWVLAQGCKTLYPETCPRTTQDSNRKKAGLHLIQLPVQASWRIELLTIFVFSWFLKLWIAVVSMLFGKQDTQWFHIRRGNTQILFLLVVCVIPKKDYSSPSSTLRGPDTVTLTFSLYCIFKVIFKCIWKLLRMTLCICICMCM